jgi:hypothetical protein
MTRKFPAVLAACAGLGGCVATPTDESQAPPTGPVTVSWSLALDVQQATCADLGVTVTRVAVYGPGQETCGMTNEGGTNCGGREYRVNCNDGTFAFPTTPGGTYQVIVILDGVPSVPGSQSAVLTAGSDQAFTFDIAHLDVRWSGAPATGTYNDIYLGVDGDYQHVPFATIGSHRVLARPGYVRLRVDALDTSSSEHVDYFADEQVRVPGVGTSVDVVLTPQ